MEPPALKTTTRRLKESNDLVQGHRCAQCRAATPSWRWTTHQCLRKLVTHQDSIQSLNWKYLHWRQHLPFQSEAPEIAHVFLLFLFPAPFFHSVGTEVHTLRQRVAPGTVLIGGLGVLSHEAFC